MFLQTIFPQGSLETTAGPTAIEFCLDESVSSSLMSTKISSECKASIAVIATMWPSVGIAMASVIIQVSLNTGFNVVCEAIYV